MQSMAGSTIRSSKTIIIMMKSKIVILHTTTIDLWFYTCEIWKAKTTLFDNCSED